MNLTEVIKEVPETGLEYYPVVIESLSQNRPCEKCHYKIFKGSKAIKTGWLWYRHYHCPKSARENKALASRLSDAVKGCENVNTEDLIPKFEVGERVIVRVKPTEGGTKPCPHCGSDFKVKYERSKYPDFETVIIGAADNIWVCPDCGESFTDNADGYWKLKTPDDYLYCPGRIAGVPYTLLERVEAPR